ncbi:MAG TPA: hypothetical protein PLV45_10720 [bacterium]|nr:hypothetical protein [bacterium]
MKERSCEEILELINRLIDGELEGELLREAEEMVQQNPQCATMFKTVSRTIELYRQRRQEIDQSAVPQIDWDALKKQIECADS